MAKLKKSIPVRECGYDLVNDGKFDEAMKLANKSLYFDKKMTRAGWDTKAYCLLKMGKYREAIAVLDKRLLFAPDDWWALHRKTRLLSIHMKLYDEAINISNKYIRIARNNPKPRKIYEAY
jgi:tetratricopeptide (TPR) repeat protein